MAAPDDAQEFARGDRRLVDMLEDPVGVDQIEGRVVIWQRQFGMIAALTISVGRLLGLTGQNILLRRQVLPSGALVLLPTGQGACYGGDSMGGSEMTNVLARVYPEYDAGGFTKYDGTLEFYGRINALLQPDMVAVDLGAGRGQVFETSNRYRYETVKIQGKVAKVIGVDVDPVVLKNTHIDEALVYDGGKLPLEDHSIDLVYSDWVLEHVENPQAFAAEVDRVLRPGGWFCARTPNSFSILAIASRAIPNSLHARVLRKIQPGRQARDVFPAYYRMNSRATIRRLFSGERWLHCSYTWNPEPAYHFGSPAMIRIMRALQYLKKPWGGEFLHVFLQKKGSASQADSFARR